MTVKTGQVLTAVGWLFAAMLFGLTLSWVAQAGDEPATEKPCAKAMIDAEKAKRIAAAYLRDLGYDNYPPGADALSWHFALRDSNCVNGQWRVHVDLGPHASTRDKGVVLVNCRTGEVEEHLATEEALAVK